MLKGRKGKEKGRKGKAREGKEMQGDENRGRGMEGRGRKGQDKQRKQKVVVLKSPAAMLLRNVRMTLTKSKRSYRYCGRIN